MNIKPLPSVEEDFDVRRTLPFTLGYAQRHPNEMESIVADRINKGVNFIIQNTVTQDRDQAYTSLIEGIKKEEVEEGEALYSDDPDKKMSQGYTDGYNQALDDIIENIVKPLYNKE